MAKTKASGAVVQENYEGVLFIETAEELEQVGASDPGYLFLGYVRIPLLDRYSLKNNSKKHDLQSLQDSFYRHGFKISLLYDPSLPNISGGLGAIQCGNGRVEDLLYIYANRVNLEVPRGILVKDGEWYAPVSFGVNDENQEEAIAFSVHENIANMLGGDGITFLDMSRLFDQNALAEQLTGLADISGDLLPIGIGGDDLDLWLGMNEHPPENEWADAMGKVQDGEKSPFQQMTFTLHDEQAEIVKNALDVAKGMGDFDSQNQNSNGNALARVCELFLDSVDGNS